MRMSTMLLWISLLAGAAAAEPGELALDSFPPAARFHFGGPLGERIDSNLEHWLLRAPGANPGMIEMFRVRDRQPKPNLVPWAGEFVGKYLISAVQTLRMSDDPRLEATVRDVITRLIQTQAEDGYLGPFPKEERLLGQWDLWGHYHVIYALLLWNERTGDEAALASARKAADLACRIYLDGNRRPLQAGSDEMNLSFITALGMLHRRTGEPRYLALMREIEKDWESAGDYLRSGLAGVEYFQSPRPRWESLHGLQGLVELYRITGEEKYKTAFLHHWNSIRRFDRRNSGAFSSGEQATGHPFAPTAIETCCTIAWMAITIDALKLTGEAEAADELELSTWNAMLGAQHPSGRWWTYSTPMDGAREASAHSIVFQSRAGTPELNCCSVNGPRGLGMLSEWAVMRHPLRNEIAVNFYGPVTAEIALAGGAKARFIQETNYPVEPDATLRLELEKSASFTLALRVPAWAADEFRAVGPQGDVFAPTPDGYARTHRTWQNGDSVKIRAPLPIRAEAGDEETAGKVSVYRGPLLLAYDQSDNAYDADAIPAITPEILKSGEARNQRGRSGQSVTDLARPWLLFGLDPDPSKALLLRDYASAGAAGTRYVSWLPGSGFAPPAPAPLQPLTNAEVPPGRMLFRWRAPGGADFASREHLFEVIPVSRGYDARRNPEKSDRVIEKTVTGDQLLLEAEETQSLTHPAGYLWRLTAINGAGRTEMMEGWRAFKVNPKLAPLSDEEIYPFGVEPDRVLISDALAGEAAPRPGKVLEARGLSPAIGPIFNPMATSKSALAFDGKQSRLTYKLVRFPEDNYTVSVRVRIDPAQGQKFGQIFSAWARGGDDPLRICVEKGKLFARIESGGAFSTEGFPVEAGRWYHVAAVKEGSELRLLVDSKRVGKAVVPARNVTGAADCALGANPHFAGDEYLAATMADFRFYARALPDEELVSMFLQKAIEAPPEPE